MIASSVTVPLVSWSNSSVAFFYRLSASKVTESQQATVRRTPTVCRWGRLLVPVSSDRATFLTPAEAEKAVSADGALSLGCCIVQEGRSATL